MSVGAPKKPESEKRKWTSARMHEEDYVLLRAISKKIGRSIVDTIHLVTTDAVSNPKYKMKS